MPKAFLRKYYKLSRFGKPRLENRLEALSTPAARATAGCTAMKVRRDCSPLSCHAQDRSLVVPRSERDEWLTEWTIP